MPWRVESREGGSGARRGVGDSGGVWEALAVALEAGTPLNLHHAAPTGQSRLAAKGRS